MHHSLCRMSMTAWLAGEIPRQPPRALALSPLVMISIHSLLCVHRHQNGTTNHGESQPWYYQENGGGRRRAAHNRDPVTAIRLSVEMRAKIDAWAAKQEDQPPRSEAIRRMVGDRACRPARSDERSSRLLRRLTIAPAIPFWFGPVFFLGSGVLLGPRRRQGVAGQRA